MSCRIPRQGHLSRAGKLGQNLIQAIDTTAAGITVN
jgi:hypothetical protein